MFSKKSLSALLLFLLRALMLLRILLLPLKEPLFRLRAPRS